ncbi:uromodulin-like [Mytilus trossulus]|uniref:uromodulin-like n=1 Tax=Mytilus trossulus TaxID=6551 RepID=UPI003006044F
MMIIDRFGLLLIISALELAHSQPGPCDDLNKVVIGDEKRTYTYIHNYTTENPFSDDRLVRQWYKINRTIGDQMVQSSPGAFSCGTWYPIWLNGNLSSIPGEVFVRNVCLQSFSNECDQTWAINIIYCCDGSFIYELTPSPFIDSGYCFGLQEPYQFPGAFSQCQKDSGKVVVDFK